jgi:V8-like Glu-specific endopeptidase
MSEAALADLNSALRELLTRETSWPKLIEVAKRLKSARRFRQLALFTERLLRRAPPISAAAVWQLHGQALVELGLLSSAESLLEDIDPLIAKIEEKDDVIAVDLLALRGRIAKQRFVDLAPDARVGRESLLADAARHYRRAFERAGKKDGLRYFPAINLAALAKLSEDNGWDLKIAKTTKQLARDVLDYLTAVADEKTSIPWWQATKADCHLALGEDEAFCESVRELVTAEKSKEAIEKEKETLEKARPYLQNLPDISPFLADAFTLASFNRQLSEVWNIEANSHEQVLAAVLGLKEALLKREGGSVDIDQASIKAYEAVLGDGGILPFRWIRQGMEAAKSVAAVIRKSQGSWKRIGTAFCVAIKGKEGLYALTNAHVVSDLEMPKDGYPVATSAAEIRVRFEALDTEKDYEVERIAWASPIDGERGYDATLLLLKSAPAEIKALRPIQAIPNPSQSRVYVIGYPKGEELSLSMQDNELLDHQGLKKPPPGDAEPVLVHYRAPTEKGSSGSPVFDDNEWHVVALHHKSREQSGSGLTLSGRRRYSRANEGISMKSIGLAMMAERGFTFDFAD